MKQIIISLLLFLSISGVHARVASIRVDTSIDPEWERPFPFANNIFVINGVVISAADSIPVKIPLNKDFDTCKFVFQGKDTFSFIARFRPKVNYVIVPGCCCSEFEIRPVKEGGRGIVKLKNSTAEMLYFLVGDCNADTVLPGYTRELFSYESVMCMSKPGKIEIACVAESSALKNCEPLSDDEEGVACVLYRTWFQFLHGEKLQLMWNEKKADFELKIIGRTRKKDYRKILKQEI